MVRFCADPAGSLLWLRMKTGAPCLRDLADFLWDKSIFGHWVCHGDMARRDSRREMQSQDGKMGLKW